jgi:cytosine deaminase
VKHDLRRSKDPESIAQRAGADRLRSLSPLDRAGLDAAIAQAEKSAREGGIPIGAALMNPDGVIVALGHNLRVQAGDPTAHAETVCIRNAGRRRDWHTLTMYTTLSPCAMCSGTAVLHAIPRVVIGEHTTFKGREDWLSQEGIELLVANDHRCRRLMSEFIAARPDLWDEDIGVPPQRSRARARGGRR